MKEKVNNLIILRFLIVSKKHKSRSWIYKIQFYLTQFAVSSVSWIRMENNIEHWAVITCSE